MKTIFSYSAFSIIVFYAVISLSNFNTTQNKTNYKNCIREAIINCEIKEKHYRTKIINKCKTLAYHNQDVLQIKNSIACKRH